MTGTADGPGVVGEQWLALDRRLDHTKGYRTGCRHPGGL